MLTLYEFQTLKSIVKTQTEFLIRETHNFTIFIKQLFQNVFECKVVMDTTRNLKLFHQLCMQFYFLVIPSIFTAFHTNKISTVSKALKLKL